MPEKSVREMSALERKHYSLAARIFHSTVIGSVLLGFVALAIGLGLYTYALAGQFISEAFNLSRNAAAVLDRVVDVETISREVMEAYRAMSPEERNEKDTEAVAERLAAMKERPDYETIRAALKIFGESSDVEYVYLAMYDRETAAMVYIVDPDEKDPLPVGYWEAVKPRGVDKFLTWDGTGRLYDIDHTDTYGWLCTSGVPIRGSDGEIAAFVLADVSLATVRHGIKSFLLQYVSAMVVAIFLFGYLMTRHMKKTLVEPINAIADAAVSYVRDKRAGVKRTDHFSRLNIRTGDEVENLGLIMADMEQDMAEIEADLTSVTAEKERIGTELSLATRIQAAMLPHIFPPFPERKEVDIFASMDPAKEVGGDFYDFFLIDEDHLGLVIADVSGKGIPAALFMMVSKIILQSCAMLGVSPGEILTKTNEAICSNNQEEMFVTAWVGILDLNTGELVAANAGHEYPILKTPEGDFAVLRDKHGFVIGGMEGMKYKEYRLQMDPGAKLFLYTDGLPEATNECSEMFGLDRVLSALNQAADEPPRKILETMNKAVALFVGDAEPFDDLTMLCLHYIGKKPEGDCRMKELTLEARVENIDAVTDFINEQLDALDCPVKARTQIDVAVDEIFANIASYAYAPGTGDAVVRFEEEKEPRSAVITFLDGGTPFNPLENQEPDVSLSAEEREVGGLGVFLVKKTMDDVSYEYKDGKNVLRMKKHF